jgi:polar amino acid transport system permease protein
MMFLIEQWPEWIGELLRGLATSVQLTIALLAVGLPLGLALALMVSSRSRWIRWTALAVVEAIRGAPVLVLLYLAYFGLPDLDIRLSAFAAAAGALGLSFGAYSSEVFRAGIAAVGQGQREAAQAVGLTSWQELRLVVLPQAVRIVIPPVLGWGIVYFQATSLAFAVSVPELISRAYTIGSASYRFLSVFLLAALLYAAVSIPASLAIDYVDRRSGVEYRPAR